jgi:hypothetical protein
VEWAWLAALAVLVLLHFRFPDLGGGLLHDSYSVSAEGKKAFFLLADEQFGLAVRDTDPLTEINTYYWPDSTLCLLGPARYPSAAEWREVLEWVGNGGSLVIAARDRDVAFTIPDLDIEVQPAEGGTIRAETSDTKSEIDTSLVGDLALLWESRGMIVAPGAQTLVECEGTVQAALKHHGTGRIVVVASDFVFSNQSLAWNDNSVLALRLIEEAGEADFLIFDESLNVTGTPKIVGVLLNPLFRPITVQLLIGLVIFAWWQSLRFGPMLPKAVSPRRNIVDHTDAVGILFYRSGDGAGALRVHLRQLITELRLKHYRGREARILEPIARRLGVTTESVRKLLRRASRAARSGKLERKQAAEFIRQIAHIRQAARPQELNGKQREQPESAV